MMTGPFNELEAKMTPEAVAASDDEYRALYRELLSKYPPPVNASEDHEKVVAVFHWLDLKAAARTDEESSLRAWLWHLLKRKAV